MRTCTRICGCTALALVLLRLAIGWHFFSEGLAKVQNPRFSAEAFLLQATGPAADYFHHQAPGFHDWREILAAPRPDRPMSADDAAKLAEWERDLQTRIEKIEKENKENKDKASRKPIPIELPPIASYQPWGDRILRDWGELLNNFVATARLDEEQTDRAREILRRYTRQLADYFEAEESAIATYRHELSRLQAMTESQAAGELPYLDERAEAKKAETRGMPGRWIADLRAMELEYVDALREIFDKQEKLSADEKEATRSLLSPDDRLQLINRGATWLTLGVGLLLLAGFFTRIASLAGALFLLAVIATQPPWIAGAAPVYNQMVECAGLCVLFATGAGRWVGLDFFFYSFWSKCCGSSG